MTLASLPFWFYYLVMKYQQVWSYRSSSQVFQCFIVAVSSGLIATVLFFFATDLVKDDPQKLATVEATQSGEVFICASRRTYLVIYTNSVIFILDWYESSYYWNDTT